MRRSLFALLMLWATALPADDVAGEFDYYVLALSWSPNYCLREGDARGAEQCRPDSGRGWVLHGLWPQYETGWPADCRTGVRPPMSDEVTAMTDIMPSAGLARYQWQKHGTCSGLPAADYFDRARQAYASVTRPDIFRRLDNPVRLPAEVVEEAFLRENPRLTRDGITITCRSGQIQEARICLTRDLAFRRCGDDIVADCTLEDALFAPLR